MEELFSADERLVEARASIERDCDAVAAELNERQSLLVERMKKLDEKKGAMASQNGNVNASDDDLVEVNAGGKVVTAKRSTLTQQVGTRMEALFSGRWDEKLQRDANGRIFLDVNPKCFRAIVDYLNELAISSKDDPPSPPSVVDEDDHILRSQLGLFGLCDQKIKESNIVSDSKEVNLLHEWLDEDRSNGEFNLLYQSSRDGLSAANFHSKCDNQGCTLTVIETTDGFVLGGYTNTPWASGNESSTASKSFLFVISGSDVTCPCKMKLKSADDGYAVCHNSTYGPTFGGGHNLRVHGSNEHVYLYSGTSYHPWPLGRLTTPTNGSYAMLEIKELEVFQVAGAPVPKGIALNVRKIQHLFQPIEPVTVFSAIVNEAINTKKESLMKAEAEILQLEESLEDEQKFIATIASGDPKDIITLNVSGTIMATKRSTLCTAEDSVLAQQFDDTKWTEQGCNASCVKQWTPDDVSDWARNIDALQEDVGTMLKENDITGSELLAMDMEGLKLMGVKRLGTLCLLKKEIEKLEKASRDVVTLVEHSPYCFGKILDHLRLSQLNTDGFVEKLALPYVCESQRSRFEKVVKYYFPGETSKFVLG
ncbi:hypothetical protein ACHAWF_007527 [Thalassiosira exigua]